MKGIIMTRYLEWKRNTAIRHCEEVKASLPAESELQLMLVSTAESCLRTLDLKSRKDLHSMLTLSRLCRDMNRDVKRMAN